MLQKNCLNLQQDVIGQSLFELTHADDAETITENLKPKGKLLLAPYTCSCPHSISDWH